MDFFNIIFRRVQGFIKSLVSKLSTSLGKLKRLPQMAAKKAKDILKGAVDFLVKKPSAMTDYIKTGNVYIAKRALFFALLLISAIVLVMIWIVVPFLGRTFFGTRIVVNTPEFYSAEGKVFLYDNASNLLYSGEMSAGKIKGDGKLYKNDILIYEGTFEANEYGGNGKLYYDTGELLYEGSFKNSLYDGDGIEYFKNGRKSRTGHFTAGVLDGEGSVFDESGAFVYTGGFSGGVYCGVGKQYEDGALLYSGEFDRGLFNGRGRKYKNGSLLYDGEFVDSVFCGSGTLYSDNGEPLYVGAFSGGEFNGQGTMNDSDGGKIEGTFEDGKASGSITLYAANGAKLFAGTMVDGKINYYSYISADKSAVEADFTAKSTVREIDGAQLYYYPDLGAGFLFNGSQTVDRIIITGDAELYGARSGDAVYSAADGATLYSSYYFRPTDFEKKLFSYIGANDIASLAKLKCEKYLTADGAFVKLYFDGDKVAYYETGAV